MLRTTTKEILLTELSNRKPEEVRLSFAIGWMRAEENLLYTSGEVLRLLEAIKGEIEPTGGNRTGSGTKKIFSHPYCKGYRGGLQE